MAQRPAGYNGQGLSLRGEKGRYVLPPAFRKSVAEASEDRILCIAKHDRWPCLTGFGRSRTETFDEQLDREQEAALRLGRDFDREMRESQLWNFVEIPFDASGRFVMPEHFSSLVGIGDAIYFQGAGKAITLWNPEGLYEMGEGWDSAQAICRALVAEAEAKRK